MSMHILVAELQVHSEVTLFAADVAVTRPVKCVQAVDHALTGVELSMPSAQRNLLGELQVLVRDRERVQCCVVLGLHHFQ